jgi:hypothetical protein
MQRSQGFNFNLVLRWSSKLINSCVSTGSNTYRSLRRWLCISKCKCSQRWLIWVTSTLLTTTLCFKRCSRNSNPINSFHHKEWCKITLWVNIKMLMAWINKRCSRCPNNLIRRYSKTKTRIWIWTVCLRVWTIVIKVLETPKWIMISFSIDLICFHNYFDFLTNLSI